MKKLKLTHRKHSKPAINARQLLIGLHKRKNPLKTSNNKGKIRLWWGIRRRWQKVLMILMVIVIVFFAQAYAIAYWYQFKHRGEKVVFGVTFIASYARYFGMDAQETFLALRDDLNFKRFRLVSYWEEIEKTPGIYDFSELDWQFDRVGEVGGEVSLAIGLRQPRWPECHIPSWLADEPKDVWYPKLESFMRATIEHYRDRPELQSYQLENEFYLSVFGDCKKYGVERQRLIDEFNLVKSLDSNHPIILSLANNYFGIPLGEPRPDQYGISVYKRVFDYTVTHRYFEYPFPAWYYSWRSGLIEIFTGRNSMVHELQAEPWAPVPLRNAPIEEQNKSMDAERLRGRIDYALDTGFRTIDLWGGEWWYWRKVNFNDPSLWNVIKEELPNPGI